MRRRFVFSCVLILSMAVSLLTGCANGASGSEESTQPKETTQKEEVNWQEQKLTEVSDITEGNRIYLARYYEDLLQEPDCTYDWSRQIGSGVSDDKFCFVSLYLDTKSEPMESNYYLDTFDLNTEERRQTKFDFDDVGIPFFMPNYCDILGGGNVVFFAQKANNNEVTNYYVVYMNAQGKCLKTLDIYPALMELGIELKGDMAFTDVVGDDEGYLYVSLSDRPCVGIIDETGALVDTVELEGMHDKNAVCSMKSFEGTPIFEASSMKEGKNTLFWYDTEKKTIQILGETNYDINAIYGGRYFNKFGEVYSILSNKIVCWNVAEGTKEDIFDCKSNGMTENDYMLKCFTNAAGELFLLDIGGEKPCLYGFSNEPVKQGAGIRIVDICNYSNDNISGNAAAFSRKNPTCHVEYESVGFDLNADLQAYRDRILAEIVSGKGPDILLVNRDDMWLLNEKGVLADISGVLPKETEEQIFKGVLSAGTIDGKLIGLASSMYIETLFVSKNVWTKDTWTVEEFVELVEEKEGELEDIFACNHRMKQPLYVMSNIAMQDLNNSPFVDLEKGESSFDSELFKQVLELAKRYGKTDTDTFNSSDPYAYDQWNKEQKELLDSGHAIAQIEYYLSSLGSVSSVMASLGEDYYCVGYPTNGESGSYLYGNSFLVVNKDAADMDMIHKYIGYLFNEENQRKMGESTVRKDVLSSYVVYPDWTTGAQFSKGGGMYVLLECKPDGTSYLEEYLELIDSCAPAPVGTQAIKDIIYEETAGYFAGEKDVDQTVEVIQRRVQLYLDEHK